MLLKHFNTINQAGNSFLVSVSLAPSFVWGGESNSSLLFKGEDSDGDFCGLALDSLSFNEVLLFKHGDSVCNQGHQYLCSAMGSKLCFS